MEVARLFARCHDRSRHEPTLHSGQFTKVGHSLRCQLGRQSFEEGSSRGALDRHAKAWRFCFTARSETGHGAEWRNARRLRGGTRVESDRRALGSGSGIGRATATPTVPVGLGFRTVYLLGCDFKMASDRKYAFDESRSAQAIRHNNILYFLAGCKPRPARQFSKLDHGDAAERPRRRFRFLARVPRGS